MFHDSYGDAFETQRALGTKSLSETINHFQAACNAEELIQTQFEHWKKPAIFDDSVRFLQEVKLPVYILSNIDRNDVYSAIEYHNLKVSGVITSEDVLSYKPRPEMFIEAMRRYNLTNTEVIHVGDSLTSDIEGAQSVGIKAVWLRQEGARLLRKVLHQSIFAIIYSK